MFFLYHFNFATLGICFSSDPHTFISYLISQSYPCIFSWSVLRRDRQMYFAKCKIMKLIIEPHVIDANAQEFTYGLDLRGHSFNFFNA